VIGQTISHYKITEKLGEGGMGVVYKAEDTELDRAVALKFLARHLVRDEEGRKRFLREAKAAAALDHQNICTVHEIGQADDQSFIVMAFLEGRTLGKRIGDGPLKLPEALSIAIQMADGLEAAHEKGIVHRDIKPDNVMLMKGSRGLVKLMDFGLAQIAQSSKLTREGTTLGTPIYMSPEQALGEATDTRSDVWALGVVLYEMVAGRPPFRGEVDQAVIYAIANEQHEPLTGVRTGVPRELERIVDKCLTKSADERYQHVSDLLVDLQRLRQQMASGPAGTASKSTPATRFSPTVMAAAGLGLVVIMGLAWWLTRSPQSAPVPQYKLTQITRDSGYTAEPALSPDGRLLAYASDRSEDGNLDIWVQQLAGGQAIQLTDHEADDSAPSFSPDGSQIVFVSKRGDGGVYLVSSLGGNVRRIAGRGSSPRFSSDGKWISYSSSFLDGAVGARSRIAIASTSGEAERTVETGLTAAREPIWSPNGKYLLFLGSRGHMGNRRSVIDWWVVPVEAGEAVSVGAAAVFEEVGIRRNRDRPDRATWPPTPRAWLADGDRVLFAASIGDGSANIWQVRVSSQSGELLGEPERLTSGIGEQDPAASPDGNFAFVSSARNWDIWSLPLDGNRAEVRGEPERVVSGLGSDQYPSISRDGRKLAYVSDRSGSRDIWLRDLATGEDTAVTIGPADDLRGTISPDGSRVAFVRTEQEGHNLHVLDLGQETSRSLAEGVASMLDWTPDGKKVLYYTPPPLRIRTVDAETGEQAEVELKHPDSSLYTPRFSPDGNWISFNRPVRPLDTWLIFIARIENGQPTPHEKWIQITQDSIASHPWWSPDGNTLYFRSNRDEFSCIWAQPLDPTTKEPRGPLKSIRHFHGRVRTNGVGGGTFGYAMTNDHLYFPLSEPKANIWLAETVQD